METISFTIEGMMCEGCVRRVERLLGRCENVVLEGVGIGWATLQLSGGKDAIGNVQEVLTAAGYRAQVRG